MDPLQTALRPLTAMLNRQIQAKSPARALCKNLDGSTVAVRVADTALTAYLHVDSDGLLLSGEYDSEPDAVLTGSLLSLLRLVHSPGENMIRDGAIEFSGDTDVAEQFQKLLQFARPDPEEELSRFVGDVAAHGIGELARSIGQWSRRASTTMQQNVSEYLQEESQLLPSRYEFDRFRRRTETLRDDVARFEATLRQLELKMTHEGSP